MQLSNPNGSGKTVYISRITGGVNVELSLLSSFSGSLTLTKGGTLTSPAVVTPINSNFSSTNTSVATVRSSTAALTGGTVFFSVPLSPGPFQYEETGRFVIPPGQIISMTVIGTLTVAGTVATTTDLMWWEA